MAIVLKNNTYHIRMDSNTIIGVMGDSYDKFLFSLEGDNIFYLDKRMSISKKQVNSLLNITDDTIIKLIKEFNLVDDFINKRINELSHSEQKLLKYLLLIVSNKKIIVINEPFQDLDYQNKKKIIILIKNLIKEHKTVIIGSNNSNIIYSLCKKVLLLKDEDYYYGNISVFNNSKLLSKYNITVPNIVEFVSLAKKKNITLNYSYDIRDLIKDVYRNVSKK